VASLVFGAGGLWQSALGFPSLSFIYKSIVFPSLWIDRQFIIFSSSPSSSRVNNELIRNMFHFISIFDLLERCAGPDGCIKGVV